jgi:hypothetical protein
MSDDMGSRFRIVTATLAAALICGGFVMRHDLSWRGRGSWRWFGGRPASHVTGLRLFDDVRQHVARDYVDALSPDRIYQAATTGMLNQLHDPRTRLLASERDRAAGDARDSLRVGVRRGVAQRPVLLERGIGYLAAPVFGDSTSHALDHAIDSLRALGMRTLILDLRHNGTSSLDRGVAVADLFLRPGETVVTSRGRGAGTTRVIVDRSAARWTGLGVILLIDSSTARGSEIVAGALQDHDRALVVGTPSSGNGGDAATFPIDGGAVRLTTARWFTPSGRRIDRIDPRWGGDDATDEGGPGDSTAAAGDSTAGGRYRTDAGRSLPAGGTIAPDVLVIDTAATAARHDLRADPVIRTARDLAARAASPSDLVLHSARTAGATDSISRGPTRP